jgi:hypothetical protein
MLTVMFAGMVGAAIVGGAVMGIVLGGSSLHTRQETLRAAAESSANRSQEAAHAVPPLGLSE